MKHLAALVATALIIPGVAVAQQAINNLSPAVNDINSDGNYSLSEVQEAYPNATQEDWDRADKNNDGILTGLELLEAVNNGVFSENGLGGR